MFVKKTIATVIFGLNFAMMALFSIHISDEAAKSKPHDESTRPKEISGLPTLPSFFDEQHFLLYGEFDQVERRLLNRYITAYDG